MRLGMYIRPCQTQTRYAGIGRYVADLTEALSKRPGLELVLLYDKALPYAHLTDVLDGSQTAMFGLPLDAGAHESIHHATALAIDALGLDWLMIPHLFDDHASWLACAMKRLSATQLALIHYDLVPLVFADHYLKSQRYAHFYRESLKSFDHFDCIASISAFSKEDLDTRFPHLKDRSVAIGTGVNPERFHVASESASDDAFRSDTMPAHYILCAPSGFDYRKNVPGLLKVYAKLPVALRVNYPLYLVGRVGDRDRRGLETLVQDLGLTDQVILTDFVEDQDLIRLYQGATLFVFPSVYEGFGLPALEAILCGCPTLAVDRSSLPEVVGTADGLVDPDHHEAWAERLEALIQDADMRTTLWEAEYRHAQTMTWERVVSRLLNALKPMPQESTPWYLLDLASVYETWLASSEASAVCQCLDETGARSLAILMADFEKQLRALQTGRQLADAKSLTWCLEGHWAGDYSLAQLNRESAMALLASDQTVRLRHHDGVCHQEMDSEAFSDWPALQSLVSDSDRSDVTVYSRNLYPPKVTDYPQDGVHVLHHYAWEESGFPMPWAFDFSQSLDGLSCLSSHVMKILIDHGVDVPMCVSGCGVRARPDREPRARTEDRFVFLHVSSCFPRKGVDVLLEAYAQAFTKNDAVVLKIKTFANPHNDVERQIERLKARYPECPAIGIQSESLSDDGMQALYHNADVLVAPSRAEGFGLPIFEAAGHGVPSIVTGWGGHLDLCHDENAWLLDYRFAEAASHFPVHDSAWAEPSVAHLVELLKQAFETPQNLRQQRADALVSRIEQDARWSQVMERHQRLLRLVQVSQSCRPRVGWITTFGERCGIATTTEMLIREMDAPSPVIFSRKDVGVPVAMDHRDIRSMTVFPSWDEFGFYGVLDAVQHYRLQSMVIQFVYPFYEYAALIELVNGLDQLGCVIVMELHESEPPRYSPERHLSGLVEALSQCDRVLVHSVNALNDLKDVGLVENVSLFPLGVRLPPTGSSVSEDIPEWRAKIAEHRSLGRTVVASYGFFLPHKGLIELISVVHRLLQAGLDVHLLLLNAEYPSPISRQAIEAARKAIRSLQMDAHVTLVTEFLEDDVALDALSEADVLVFPYRTTEQGASGAVRFGLACEKPVMTSDLPIFDEFAGRVARFTSDRVDAMAEQLQDYIERIEAQDSEIQSQLDQVRDWLATHNYGVLAKRYYGMLTALVRQRRKGYE